MKIEQLVNETFRNPFNMEQYKEFLSNLLNIPITKQKNVTNFIGKEYMDYVSSVNELGYFKDQNNSYIYIYTVELKKESSIYKARTMQRNLIAKLLKTNFKDNALVAFYEQDNPDWRFSFVNREYELTEKGISEKLSPAKRYSFLVGPNEPNHTCRKQFVSRIIQENITVEEIKEAFNIENVTKEFFKEYRELFLKLDKSLKKLVKNDTTIANEFDDKNIQTEDFAKKIMGQIVFLYFIQKKGWLGVDKDKEWGTGPKNFMRKLFNKEYIEYENFFNDVLEPLFYKGLSEDVTDYHYELFNCKVPFLNGGLFENINGYNWIDTDILIDNKIFEEILNTFDTYNFTIKEDEPLDKEVAVDPEMLGKVFENLLTSIERKKNGTFYTPRNIVHFMCQQTLIEYLKTNSSINEDDLREFIEKGYLSIDSIIRHNDERRKYNGKTFTSINLPKSIQDNPKDIDNLLQNVKIVDPAVGSGAFPVGMMYEIVNARYLLNLIMDNPIDLYTLKKETIENSLYGVDLSYSATDITKLRFWLSLIVDGETIEPLPNLDNKILAGNSILDTFHGIKIYDKSIIENNQTGQLSLFESYDSRNKFKKMDRLKHEFFNEKSPNKKKELKKQIDDMKWKFIESSIKDNLASDEQSILKELDDVKNMNSKPFFVWELEFSEVFQTDNPGFDIVIGNPPYVKETKKNGDIFDLYKKSPYYKAKMDLWYFFACNGIDLLKKDGNLCFIAPNNWTTNDGASKLREKIIEDSKIKFYVDFGNYHVFESASIQTMILSLNKTNINENYSLKYSLLENEKEAEELMDMVLSQKNNLYFNQIEFNDYKKYMSNIEKRDVKGEYIKFLDEKVSYILKKISSENEFVHYLNKSEVSQGIVSPQDKLNKKNKDTYSRIEQVGAGIFVLSTDEMNSLNLTEKELELIKPFYTSNEIKRFYTYSNNNEWLIYTQSEINKKINEYPNIKNHLDNYQELITSSNKPYGLHRSRKEHYFKGEKIISIRKCIIPSFSYVDFDSYVAQTFILIQKEDVSLKYLTGILNSNITQFVLKFKGKMQGNNYQVDQNPLYKIPLIYNKNKELENEITSVVEKIIVEKNENKYINYLNNLVYDLYGLNEEEIEIIENNI